MTDYLTILDALAEDASANSLKFGWVALDYYEEEKPHLIAEFGSERAALSETIKFIHDREAKFIVARSTVADRMRVARYMTRDKYQDIYDETGILPSFHQIRMCLVTEKGEINQQKSDEIVAWCVSNSWPTVQEIREHRTGQDKIPPQEQRWQRIVDLAFIAARDYSEHQGRFKALQGIINQQLAETRK